MDTGRAIVRRRPPHAMVDAHRRCNVAARDPEPADTLRRFDEAHQCTPQSGTSTLIKEDAKNDTDARSFCRALPGHSTQFAANTMCGFAAPRACVSCFRRRQGCLQGCEQAINLVACFSV